MTTKGPVFADAGVEAAFSSYPAPVRSELVKLRQLIFDTARSIDRITVGDEIPEPELRECIGMALTYHRRDSTPDR